MKLTIFGATGKTGRHLLEQALAKGHQVTVLARSPDKLAVRHDHLKVIQGDIRDAEKVAQAVAGAEAVISVLGPTSNKPELAVSQGMDNILAAMRQHGVRRLVQSAGAGVRDPQDIPTPVHAFFGKLVRLISPNVVADMEQMVDKVRASGLDWTIVRAPRLMEAPGTGQVKAGFVGKDLGTQLTRADMARFMLDEVEAGRWVGRAPAVSN